MDGNPGSPERNLESDVAHDRGHDGVPRQLPHRHQVARADEQHGVTIDHLTLAVNQDRPIAVAVEGHPQPAPLIAHDALKRLGVRGATSGVDVAPVRLDMEGDHVTTERSKHVRSHPMGRAVRAIDGHPARRHTAHRAQHRLGVGDIGVRQLLRLDRLHGNERGLPARIIHLKREPGLEISRRLRSGARQHLDAVVRKGVMRRRDNKARVEMPGPGQKRRRRGRHDAHTDESTVFRGNPCRQLALNPGT